MTGSQTLNPDQRGGGSVSGGSREGRKQGVAIGSDFVFEECEIPGEDEMEFKLDAMGVFQVYENQTGTSTFQGPLRWLQYLTLISASCRRSCCNNTHSQGLLPGFGSDSRYIL